MTLTLADLRMDLTDDGEVGKGSGPRSDRPKRRSFTPEHKLAMVEAYDAATEPGAKGALLRREGLYTPTASWGRSFGPRQRPAGRDEHIDDLPVLVDRPIHVPPDAERWRLAYFASESRGCC
ncbi:hypothetical protein ABZU75_44725 [Streptosporangium sp. NPDC005286]|uniref:hypothetical protein n=1 Tax=Streptosporangium sp. NPDC005286 TaxID=3154463 RepID=UPI0033B1777E